MPLRTRAGSSPLRSAAISDGPSVLVTSPSRPTGDTGLRRGSLGAADPIIGRPRKDTTTSSEFSSENELDPSYFQRKQINPRRAAKASHLLSERIQEDEREAEHDLIDADAGAESDSTMSSEFAGTEETTSILDEDVDPLTSLPMKLPGIPTISTPQNISPKKGKLQLQPAVLQALPPPRPISMIAPPVSALTRALKAKNKAPESPFDRFATMSGKGEANPLYIKIYAPFSSKPSKPYEILLRRIPNGGGLVTVAEAIGLALYRFGEDKLDPPIAGVKMNVNRWNFRMVDDEEVEYDFPALARTAPITDFTSNNNRPARGRARDKPWDEFGLVEASDREFKENEALTPQYSKQAAEALSTTQDTAPTPQVPGMLAAPSAQLAPSSTPVPTPSYIRNPITGPSFSTSTLRMDSKPLLDLPAVQASTATPRTGAPKTITIHFTDENFLTRTTLIEVTTDTYIAEVFDQACKRLSVDKALYVLKVSGSTTVAPSDRTVEALGDRGDLDLVRRRFIGDGAFGLSGSPGSSSPNAPLLIAPGGTPKKSKKSTAALANTTIAQQKSEALAALAANSGTYKRYNVTRKQPMSFSSSSARVLALDEEYMHIMPSSAEHHPTTTKIFEAPGKVTTVHFSSVVGSKVSRRHPRMFRVVVYKERETKRYDFEASTGHEAHEIVRQIKRGVEKYQEGVL
jgi:hypothetical protein